MILKYIIIENSETPIIFSRHHVSHLEVAESLGKVKSAGFCRISHNSSGTNVICYGSSSTLAIDSNPLDDEKIICKMFNEQ